MKRYYVEMYHGNKFVTNSDFDSMDSCALMLDDVIDKVQIKDTKTDREYVMKWGETK